MKSTVIVLFVSFFSTVLLARDPSIESKLTPSQSKCSSIIALVSDIIPIYDVQLLSDAIASAREMDNRDLMSFYFKMNEKGPDRPLVAAPNPERIRELSLIAPHLQSVIDQIAKQVAMQRDMGEPVHFEPLLLVGGPGLGKTYFAKKLAEILGTNYEFISMSSLTAGWVIGGASSGWKNAKPGKVATTLLNAKDGNANPLFVIDEIDKAGKDDRYNPLGAFYSLLERSTAEQFTDEFVDLPINARHTMWIATANDINNIPGPILNRMNVVFVEKPDFEGLKVIAKNVYSDILKEHPKWESYPDHPSEKTLKKVAQAAPRDMRKLLLDGFWNSHLAKRSEILPEDINLSKIEVTKTRIGF